jgi:hypothetical protein
MDTDKDKTPQVETPEDKFIEEDGQGTLFEKPPQRWRSIEVSSPVFEKRNLLRNAVSGITIVGEVFRFLLGDLQLLKEKGSPVLRREAIGRLDKLNKITTEVIPTLEESFKEFGDFSLADLGDDTSPERLQELLQDTPLEKLRQINTDIQEIAELISVILGEISKYYDVEVDPDTGERRLIEFKGTRQTPPPPESTNALEELKRLSKIPPLGQINISKDLVSSEFSSLGDILEIGTEEEKQKIQNLQKKGKLLFGTMEGLSGGTAFFKSVSIALAKILNEQSNYYNHPDGQRDKLGGRLLSGVPMDKIREIFGESAKLEKLDSIRTPKVNGEDRPFPFIILSYERLARELSKTGKISGGKDIEFVKLYINGGYREFETDPKTGQRVPVKSSYVPGVTSKKYPISNGKGGFIFVPFVVNEFEIVDTSRKDPEVGCLLRLSPQYAKTLRGYTALRGDTIQLIGGGGKQKDITMDLISFLVFSRNTAPVLRKLKREILSKYEKRPTYRGRPGKLETHFREAVQKSVDARILLPGTDRKGNLLGYREELNSGGEIVSVFNYNPEYLKGEEISRGDLAPEEQTGEE